MKVSATIPVYNQSDLTERCLQTLLNHSCLLTELVVINNASSDNTPEVLSGFQPQFEKKGIQFKVITNTVNVGFGRACNQGIREFLKGEAQYLVVLSNDVWLMPNWDKALIDSLIRYQLDCVGPYNYEKPLTENIAEIAAQFVKRNGWRLRHHFVPILFCLTRSATEKLSTDCAGSNGGIFDERYFVTYEDADLLKRMELLNLRFGQTGSCFIWHKSKGTRSQSKNNHEEEGHRLFLEKWNFDPRPHKKGFWIRMRQKCWKLLEKAGLF